nr:radical SAM family heme chaperone HemW [uncultured Anaerostipes sp.]
MKIKDMELYIHIPFCRKKCNYCDFCSFPSSKGQVEAYMAQLESEIRAWGESLPGRKISTVFIGGGTPSLLNAGQIRHLMQTVRDSFQVEKKAEITMEANPGTVSFDRLKGYLEAGVSRLSFGLQSMQEEELQYLGRIHSREDFLSGFEAARAAGFQNISVDLMSGIPKQTMESFEDTLRKTAKLGPEHISAYSLIIEDGTPFAEDENLEELLPSEEDDVRMYEMTEKILEEYGYHKYEISNYSKPGYECRHNLGYWSRIPYLGVGLNAASYLEEKRFQQTESMKEYLDQKNFLRYFEEARPLSWEEQVEEFMFLGLRRTAGVKETEFEECFGRSMESVYGPVIEKAEKGGWIKRNPDQIALTQQGILFSNQVLSEFLLSE